MDFGMPDLSEFVKVERDVYRKALQPYDYARPTTGYELIPCRGADDLILAWQDHADQHFWLHWSLVPHPMHDREGD